jgi:hypothetical protein
MSVLTDEEAAARIAELRTAHREALSTPLASEGGVSAYQLYRMSDKAREKWSRLGQERMRTESEIRSLSRPYDVRAAEAAEDEARESLKIARGRIDAAVGGIDMCFRLGMGKRGKLRPTWQRTVDSHRATIAEALARHPELMTDKVRLALGME